MKNILDLRKKVEPQVRVVYQEVVKTRPWYIELAKIFLIILFVTSIVWSLSKADEIINPISTASSSSSDIIDNNISTETSPNPSLENGGDATTTIINDSNIFTIGTSSVIDNIIDSASTTIQNILDTITAPNPSLENEGEATTTEIATTTYDAATSTDIITQSQTTDTGKIVTVSADNEDPAHPILNVLASTTIPKIFKVGQEDKIKIKWTSENNQDVSFHAYDTNGDGYLDYVEWTVPHLSTQTFEIIFISKAFELDENKEIINDIYEQTVAKDNVWVTIPDTHYIRATFERNLVAGDDMTIYAKGEGSIKVFNENGNDIIGTFTINGENTYKIYPNYGDSAVYDLLFSGNIEVDYIVDPTANITQMTVVNKNGVNGGDVRQREAITFNVLAGGASSALLKIWQGVVGVGTAFKEQALELIGGIWTVSFNTDATWPTAGTSGSCVGYGFGYGYGTCISRGYGGVNYSVILDSNDSTTQSDAFVMLPQLFTNGSGTVDDPYIITTWTELDSVRQDLSAGVYYKLGNNLDTGTTGYATYGANWTPIGNTSTAFSGNFNGNGKTITGLNVTGSNDNVGLFGYLSGNISNVGLINVNVSGNSYVGGLVGWQSSGTITNSYSTGNVSGSGAIVGGLVGLQYGTITNSYSTGNVNGSGNYVGGLVGWQISGSINNSYSTGSVSGSRDVGGMVGSSEGSITNSYSTGNVSGSINVGGMVGFHNSGSITNSYSTGNVSGSSGNVGGLVGLQYSDSITNSYSTGNVNGSSNVGGLVGWQISGSITNSYWDKTTSGKTNMCGGGLPSVCVDANGKTTAEMKTLSTFSAWGSNIVVLANYTNQTWAIDSGNTYPMLGWLVIGTWNGSANDGNLNNPANWTDNYPCDISSGSRHLATIPSSLSAGTWPSTGTCYAYKVTNNGTVNGGTFITNILNTSGANGPFTASASSTFATSITVGSSQNFTLGTSTDTKYIPNIHSTSGTATFTLASDGAMSTADSLTIGSVKLGAVSGNVFAGGGTYTVTNGITVGNISDSFSSTSTVHVTGDISAGTITNSIAKSHSTVSANSFSATSNGSLVVDGTSALTVSSDLTLAGSEYVAGTITAISPAKVIFTAGSYNTGTITGNAKFSTTYYDSTAPTAGTFTISGSNQWQGSVSGTITGSDNNPITTFAFSGTSHNEGSLTAPAVSFSGTSYNSNTVTASTTSFYATSTNAGSIIGNVSVYYPHTRPFTGGNISGTITYYNYPGLYFNDKNTLDGNWNNVLNWWTDDAFTIQATYIPKLGDDVFIYSSVSTTTATTTASVATATFYGTSTNSIALIATGGSTFMGSSTNAGNITGNVVFRDNGSTYQSGTISGTITRLFTESVATVRNFVTEGGRNNWILIAQNSIVDLSNAVYSLVTNIFKALGNGSFISNSTNNGGASVTPVIIITSPTTGVNAKWAPVIDWGTGTSTCEYKMESETTYNTLVCSNNGSDIPRPTSAEHTLWLRATDALGNQTEKTISFTYDNTLPTYTTCGTDQMDEDTRPYYYLASDVTGDCTITYSGAELRGNADIAGSAFTLTGNVTGAGLNFSLKNIIVTGVVSSNPVTAGANAGNITITSSVISTTTANGADGSNSVDGGNGGTITVATSTTGIVSANGGNVSINANTVAKNGGNGGTINITYSTGAVASTTVSALGGNSTVCGDGGTGGDITVTDSDNYAIADDGGAGHVCADLSHGSSGSRGNGLGIVTVNHSPSWTPPAPTVRPSTGGGSYTYKPNAPIPTILLPVATLKPLRLTPLPTFGGTGINSFSFWSLIKSFLFEPIPQSLTNTLKLTPDLAKYFAGLGLNYNQDLVKINIKPIVLKEPKKDVAGLFTVSSKGKVLETSLTYTEKIGLYQTLRVSSSTVLDISLTPTVKNDLSGKYAGKPFTFVQAGDKITATIKTGTTTGQSVLSTKASPILLVVEIIAPSPPILPVSPSPRSWWQRIVDRIFP